MVMGYSSRLRKSLGLRRKVHILRALNASNPKRSSSSVAMDAFLYVHFLKVKLEAIKSEYSHLLAMKKQCLKLLNHNHTSKVEKEVNVKKTEEGFLAVRVRCKKQEDTLVSVLQVFEEMGLHVLHAKVSCGNDMSFSLEALITTVIAQQLDATEVEKAIIKAINLKQ